MNGQLLIESFKKWTEPSAKAKLAPPGWKLDGLSAHASVYSSETAAGPFQRVNRVERREQRVAADGIAPPVVACESDAVKIPLAFSL